MNRKSKQATKRAAVANSTRKRAMTKRDDDIRRGLTTPTLHDSFRRNDVFKAVCDWLDREFDKMHRESAKPKASRKNRKTIK